jgi:hypothetical protein
MVHMTHRFLLPKWDNRAMWAPSGPSYGGLDGTTLTAKPRRTGMTTQTPTVLDTPTALALAADFHRCFSGFTARDDLFASDTFYDLLPPLWRFQIEGPGAAFCEQLRSIAEGSVEIEVVRTLPTSSGFVTEHVETQHTPHGDVVARRLHLCEVRNGQICAVTTYCNGGWDGELRARHAAEAPMIRP